MDVSTELGVDVGTDVGDELGTDDGSDVGADDGNIVGFDDGILVGLVVGAADIVDVGSTWGSITIVGESVVDDGHFVGAAVWAQSWRVGDDVGAGVR